MRIHGLLDDCSRFVVALEAHEHEREVDMLGLMSRALRRHGAPDVLYLDNGSTYRGEQLQIACRRLGIALVHAKPYSPQSRGKMERFWRTLREGCLDFLGKLSTLHDINVRLAAFLEERYHYKPHSGLIGNAPGRVYGAAETTPVSEERLREALTVQVRRRLRGDNTVSIEGRTYQVRQSFLAKKVVTVTYVELDDPPAPVIEHEGRTYPLEPVDPTANGKTRRQQIPKPPQTASTSFDPNEAALETIRRRLREEEEE
ncbi:MAG: transposase family protein [Verrucomicrobiae bacterium]|nr:transposase family protein [Verrucomicrobiae bacterium]